MIKGIIFDLDGVLTHTSEEHFEAWSDLATKLGKELPPWAKDATRGISRMDSLEVVLQAIGLTDYTDEEKVELASWKNRRYQALIEHFTPNNLEPGTNELLAKLKEMGLKVALASASKNAQTLLDRLEIRHWFDTVVDPSQIRRGKPDPEMFLTAAKGLGLKPEECLGVEDAASGIESIQRAGMKAIGIGEEAVAKADWRFKDLAEAADWLIDYLKERNNGKC